MKIKIVWILAPFVAGLFCASYYFFTMNFDHSSSSPMRIPSWISDGNAGDLEVSVISYSKNGRMSGCMLIACGKPVDMALLPPDQTVFADDEDEFNAWVSARGGGSDWGTKYLKKGSAGRFAVVSADGCRFCISNDGRLVLAFPPPPGYVMK